MRRLEDVNRGPRSHFLIAVRAKFDPIIRVDGQSTVPTDLRESANLHLIISWDSERALSLRVTQIHVVLVRAIRILNIVPALIVPGTVLETPSAPVICRMYYRLSGCPYSDLYSSDWAAEINALPF